METVLSGLGRVVCSSVRATRRFGGCCVTTWSRSSAALVACQAAGAANDRAATPAEYLSVVRQKRLPRVVAGEREASAAGQPEAFSSALKGPLRWLGVLGKQ